jgi:DNA polymerase III delta prime subunit
MFFDSAVRAGRLAHAYLLIGDDDALLSETALYAAMAANCTDAQRPCYLCPSCTQFQRKLHPDLIEVGHEAVPKADELRDMIRRVNMRPVEAEKKIVLLHHASLIEAATFDIALKTIEEPPFGTVFFMLATHLTSVPQTIRSRAQKVRVFSSGLPSKTLPASYVKRRMKVFAEGRFSVDTKDRRAAETDALLALDIVRDAMVTKVGVRDAIKNIDIEADIDRLSARSTDELIAAADRICEYLPALESMNLGLAKELFTNVV